MTKVIGLTGGIGSGKTEVARMLAELGASVIEADEVAHRAYLPACPAWREIVGRWGKGVLKPDGTVDRQKLAGIVFSDPNELASLNRIVHGRMFRMLRKEIARRKEAAAGKGVIVLEAAVLIEAGWVNLVDEVWVVMADEVLAVERMTRLKGMHRADVLARMHSQLPAEERARHASVIIQNDGSLASLRDQVAAAWERLLADG